MVIRGKRCTYVSPYNVQGYYRGFGEDIIIVEPNDFNGEYERIHQPLRKGIRTEVVKGLKRINLEDFL